MQDNTYKIYDENGVIYEKYLIVANEIGSNKNVIELGCYDGSFCCFLRQKGNFVTGVESDAVAFKSAQTKCDLAYKIDLNNPEELIRLLQDKKFQYVLSLDVLEHLIDPGKLLNGLKKYCVDMDCYLLVTLPNIAFWGIRKNLLLGNFEYNNVGILDKTHLKFYTYHSAVRLFETAGYRILEWKPVSYMAPLLGRMGLRNQLLRSFTTKVERYLAFRFPNFFCSQIYFKLVPTPTFKKSRF